MRGGGPPVVLPQAIRGVGVVHSGPAAGEEAREMSASLRRAAVETLRASGRFEVAEDLGVLPDGKRREDRPVEALQVLCSPTIGALLVVERHDIHRSNSVQRGEDSQGTTRYTADTDVTIRTDWRVLDCTTGHVIEDLTVQHDRSYSSAASDETFARETTNQGGTFVSGRSRAIGVTLAQRLTPVPVTLRRRVLTDGHEGLGHVAQMLADGHHDRARAALEAVLNDPAASQAVRGQASFDLAVVAEAEGQLDEALERIDQAKALGVKGAARYRKQLEKLRTWQTRVQPP